MRAYTSLIGHILGSHAQVNGYYEMHLSYQDEAALEKQIDEYRKHDSMKAGSDYMFDKLLHNTCTLKESLFNENNAKILVSLRAPEATIKSIVSLFAGRGAGERYASMDEAVTYYLDRIESLAAYCASLRLPFYYYDAEMLKAGAEILLPKLTQWLQLDSLLSAEYDIFSQTGKPRKGDSSENIKRGTIDKSRTDYSHITIPDAKLEKVQQVYRQCREKILSAAADSVCID